MGEVADVRDGTHDSPKFYEYGHPLVTSKNLTESGLDMTNISFISIDDFKSINKRSRVDIGDIIFGMIGTIGNPVIIERDDFAIKNVALIKKGAAIPNDFLIQHLKSPVFESYIHVENAGNTQRFLSLSKIRDYILSIPTSKEMTAIGNFFRTLDNIILLYKRKANCLKQLKKAYLQQMFPQEEERVPKIRFSGFTGNWEVKKLGDVADIIGGGTPDTTIKEYWGGDIDWYSPFEVSNQIFISTSQRKITELGLQKSSAKVLPAGTILFTSRAGIGNTAILAKEGATNQGFQSIVPFQKILDTYFLYSRTHELKRYGEITGAGSTFVEVSGKQMSNMPILIPTISEQIVIGNIFRALDNQITVQVQKHEQLKMLKTVYLQKMFI